MTEDEKTTLEKLGNYALQRLKEPSTWAGIAVFATSFGFSKEHIDQMVTNGPMIIGLIATVIAVVSPSGSRKAIKLASVALETSQTANQAVGQIANTASTAVSTASAAVTTAEAAVATAGTAHTALETVLNTITATAPAQPAAPGGGVRG